MSLDRLRRIVPFVLFALLVSGCSSAYWKDRRHDVAQIFDAGVTWGPGLSLSVRATEAAQLGMGAFRGRVYGLEDGRLTTFREQRGEFGASILHVYEYRRDGEGKLLDVHHPRWADPGFDDHLLSKDLISDRRKFDVGASVHLALLGIDVTLRPDEFLDLLAGFFGRDPKGDDAFSSSREEILRRARSLDGRVRAAAFDALLRRGEGDYNYSIYTVEGIKSAAQRRAQKSLENETRKDLENKARQQKAADVSKIQKPA